MSCNSHIATVEFKLVPFHINRSKTSNKITFSLAVFAKYLEQHPQQKLNYVIRRKLYVTIKT